MKQHQVLGTQANPLRGEPEWRSYTLRGATVLSFTKYSDSDSDSVAAYYHFFLVCGLGTYAECFFDYSDVFGER